MQNHNGAGVKGGETTMKEIKNKMYDINGLLMIKHRIYPDVPMTVLLTRDKLGCTVSIGCEGVDMQFTIPFDKMLKDLEGDE
jgi:hypothetical protein